MATKTALVILSPGSEEMELIIAVDVLRRAGVSTLHSSISFHCHAECRPNLSRSKSRANESLAIFLHFQFAYGDNKLGDVDTNE